LERKRERGNRGRGFWEKERRQGVFGLKAFFFLPGSQPVRGRGGLGRRRPAGLPATTAAGERGKRERTTRGFFSLTHLGSRRREGLVPRAAADRWGGVRGGGALVLGQGKEVAVVRCGGPGSGRPLFIGGERRFGRGFF
jgi:hypothetical protein